MVDRRHLPFGLLAAVALATALLAGPGAGRAAAADSFLRGVRIMAPSSIRLQLAGPLADTSAANFRVTEAKAPDVPLTLRSVTIEPGNRVRLAVAGRVDPAGHYRVEIRNPQAVRNVAPPPWVLLFTLVVSAALINNFVFTRYLGLCVFFGVSSKRETAVGMGITFTLVMVLSAMLSWVLYVFVMKPLHLRFLQVIVFIGVVAFLVQMLDTVLKKTHRALHQKFGIYLVLITTNCIILAVPLLNAAQDASVLDSLALAVGSGLGFALALFLMSCAREKVSLARVPAAFQGMPIAFALAGLFALAFMGFSGLNFLR